MSTSDPPPNAVTPPLAQAAARTCSRCGAVLFGKLLEGLCPRCMAQANFRDANAAEPARVIGNYELISELGRGGMGVVYLARQRTLDRLVALKVLVGSAHAGAAAEERFLREARSVARLHHPHIVAIHEVGRDDGRPFYSMELIEGEDLTSHALRRSFTPRDSATLVAKAARAVQHAHDAGVLHRDLKPANLLIDAAREPHLTDFGLAVAVDGSPALTMTGEVLGSPSYMAPEQLRGEASAASDVYGLGAVLYGLLTGRPPFSAAQLPDLIAAVERGDPVPPTRLDPSLPRDLETVALCALAREPARRYASAAALAEDLERWVAGRPILARPASRLERAGHWARRNRTVAILAAALAGAVAIGLGGIFSQWIRAQRAVTTTALHLYSADLKVASDALVAGNLGLAQRRLEACPVALRDPAWGLLWPVVRGDVETQIGSARWTITHLAVSPDGARVANTAQADNVRIWNLVTAAPAGELPDTAYSWWTEFSRDGRQLFTADRTVKLWDVASRRLLREFPGQSGALSPNGEILFTCEGHRFVFEGQPGAVTAWRVADGTALFKLGRTFRNIAVSPNGRLLAVSDGLNSIALYDANDGHPLGAPWPAIDRVWSLTFSPDSTQLVASGWSANVRIWNVAEPTRPSPVRLLKHPSPTWDAAFSSDGTVLAVASSDSQVHLWETRTWRETGVLRGHTNEVWALAWQPDGRLLSGGRDPRLLRTRVEARPEIPGLRHDPYSFNVVWLNAGRLATVREIGGAHFAEIASARNTGEAKRFAGEIPLAFDAADERLWLWADNNELRSRRGADLEEIVRVPWKLLAGESLAHLPRVMPGLGLAWTALSDGALVIHRLGDGSRAQRFERIFVHPTDAAAMSPDGRCFVWGGLSTELFMLDLRTGERRSLEGHRYEVSSVDFAPDGKTFVSGGADGLLIAWDAGSGRRQFELGQHPTSVGWVAFSPDGKVLFSQEPGAGIHLWHPATGREVGYLPVLGTPEAQWLGLSPDGRWFGFRVADGAIRTLPIATPSGETP